jgi:hypothetical protein
MTPFTRVPGSGEARVTVAVADLVCLAIIGALVALMLTVSAATIAYQRGFLAGTTAGVTRVVVPPEGTRP